MKRLLALSAAIALAAVMFIGCGESKPKISAEDEQAFKTAAAEFCKKKNMGMVMDRVQEATINGDKAEATCKMKLAEGMGPRVVWKIKFVKKDGKWEMVSFSR